MYEYSPRRREQREPSTYRYLDERDPRRSPTTRINSEADHLLDPFFESPRSGKSRANTFISPRANTFISPRPKEKPEKEDESANKIKELEATIATLQKEKSEQQEKISRLNTQVERLEKTREMYYEERKDRAKFEQTSSKQQEILTTLGSNLAVLDSPIVSKRIESELKRRRTSINFDFSLTKFEMSRNFFRRMVKWFWRFVHLITLMTSALEATSKRFDKTINAYFFLNFIVVNTNWVSVPILGYLIIAQIIYVASNDPAVLPLSFFSFSYSKYPTKYALGYSLTFFILALILFFSFIYRFVKQSYLQHKLAFTKSYTASHLVFGEWNWNFNTKHKLTEKEHIFATKTKVLVEEINYEKFPEEGKVTFVTFCIRCCTFLLTVGMLVASWAIIIFGPFNPKFVEKLRSSINVIFIPEMIIGVMFAVYNHLYPTLISLLTYGEDWKLAKDRNFFLLWRYFASKMINIILVILNLTTILYRPPNWQDYTFNQVLTFASYPQVECPEDQYLLWLFGLLVGDVIFEILQHPIPALSKKIWSLFNRIPYYKPSFKPEIAAARLISMQCWVWAILPYYPLVVFIGLAVNIGIFLYMWFIATYLRTAPSNKYTLASILSSNMMFFGISISMFVVYIVYFLQWPFTRTIASSGQLCGPFTGEGDEIIAERLRTNVVSSFIVDMLGLPIVLWLIIIILFVNVIFLANKTHLWKEFFLETEKKNELKRKEMNKRYNLVESTLKQAKEVLIENKKI